MGKTALEVLQDHMMELQSCREVAKRIGMPTEKFTKEMDVCLPILHMLEQGNKPSPEQIQYIETIRFKELEQQIFLMECEEIRKRVQKRLNEEQDSEKTDE